MSDKYNVFDILTSGLDRFQAKPENEKVYAGKDFYIKSGTIQLLPDQVEYNQDILSHLQMESVERNILLLI